MSNNRGVTNTKAQTKHKPYVRQFAFDDTLFVFYLRYGLSAVMPLPMLGYTYVKHACHPLL